MGKKFWDKDETERQQAIEDSAQEILDEMDETEEVEEEYEEEEYESTSAKKVVYKLDSREASVVSDAMVRLEQARLYDMLIKHDLFKGVKANPRALRAVQNEIKSYIVLRLEILLGLKKERSETVKKAVIESPFNDVEIEFLKALSVKGTNGASLKAPPKQFVVTEEEAEEFEEVEEEQGLQSMAQEEETEEFQAFEAPQRRKVVKKQPPQKKAVKSAPAKPLKAADGIKRRRSGEISDAEAMELAREDMKREEAQKAKKSLPMSSEEILAMNKRKHPPGYIPIQPFNGVVNPTPAKVGNADPNSTLGNMLANILLK